MFEVSESWIRAPCHQINAVSNVWWPSCLALLKLTTYVWLTHCWNVRLLLPTLAAHLILGQNTIRTQWARLEKLHHWWGKTMGPRISILVLHIAVYIRFLWDHNRIWFYEHHAILACRQLSVFQGQGHPISWIVHSWLYSITTSCFGPAHASLGGVQDLQYWSPCHRKTHSETSGSFWSPGVHSLVDRRKHVRFVLETLSNKNALEGNCIKWPWSCVLLRLVVRGLAIVVALCGNLLSRNEWYPIATIISRLEHLYGLSHQVPSAWKRKQGTEIHLVCSSSSNVWKLHVASGTWIYIYSPSGVNQPRTLVETSWVLELHPEFWTLDPWSNATRISLARTSSPCVVLKN